MPSGQAPLETKSRRYSEIVTELANAQKGTKGAPAYSRYVNRRLGRRLAAAAYLIGLMPNQVTVISAMFSFAAIVALIWVHPSFWLAVLVTSLLLIGYAFDSADGQLARLCHASSKAGEWLDHMVDAAKVGLLHAAVLISCYRFGWHRSHGYLLIPLGFGIVASVLFFSMTLNDQLRRQHALSHPEAPKPPTSSSTLHSLAVAPTDYGVLCAVFLLLGWQAGFRVVYAVLFVCYAGFLLLAVRKWFREMKALR